MLGTVYRIFFPVSTTLQYSPSEAKLRIHEVPNRVTLQSVLSKPQYIATVSIKKKMT